MTNHAEREHSIVGASGFYRWSVCPGSVRLSRMVNDKRNSPFAAEGTLAHQIADKCLSENLKPESFLGTKHVVDGFDFTVEQEMVDAIDLYLSTVRDEYDPAAGDVLFVEQRFHLKALHEGLFGTNDAGVYHAAKRKLTIFDLKYGAGVRVSAVNNGQLVYYALGALDYLGPDRPVDEIEVVIVQPRGGGEQVKRWALDLLDLFEFAGTLVDAVERTEDPEAPLKAGDHCRFCSAKALCPALRDAAYDQAGDDFKALPAPAAMSPADIADALDNAYLLETWIEGVRDYAYRAAVDELTEIPRYKIVAKRAIRRWTNEELTKQFLVKMGVREDEFLTEPKLRSPAQVEKLLPKPDRPKLADLVTAESNGTSLVPEDDHREDLKRLAQRDFGPVSSL